MPDRRIEETRMTKRSGLRVCVMGSLACVLFTTSAGAQDPTAPNEEPRAAVKLEKGTSPKGEPPPPATAELSKLNPGMAPWARETGWFHNSMQLEWHGGLETDVGYARYT